MTARSLLLLMAGGAASIALLAAFGPPSPAAEAPADGTTPTGEVFALELFPPSEAARRGQEVYLRNCVGCHGPQGRGDGPAAAFLDPLPRNFQKAKFKFRSTPSGELPTDADLLHVVTCGLKGSAMPGFPLMPDPEKRDVVAWVRHLAEYGLVRNEVEYVMQDEHLTLKEVLDEHLADIVAEMRTDAYENVWPVTVPPDPGPSAERIERGRQLYQAQCVACHGAGGRGDGSSSYHLRDWQDAEIRPRDFTTGVFRAGSTPADLFLRMRTGLTGTPMPAVSGSDADLWALVHYILSLKDPEAARDAVHPTSCEAHLAGSRAP